MTTAAELPRANPGSTMVDLLRMRAATRPEDVAYCFLRDGEADEIRITNAELELRARSIGAALLEGAGIGERAMLVYPPGLEFVEAFYACLGSRVVAVPVYPPAREKRDVRFESVLRDARPRIVATVSALVPALRTVLDGLGAHGVRIVATDAVADEAAIAPAPEASPEDLAFLQYTSGSTGLPKGVMLTHANLMSNQEMIFRAFAHADAEAGVCWLPTFHDMGLIGHVCQALYVGKPNVLMSPFAFLQRPMRWLQAISRYRATTSGAPDFAYALCARRARWEELENLDLSCWRVAYSGSEPIRPETLDRFARTFEPCGFRRSSFLACYGMAECTLYATSGEAGVEPVRRRFSRRGIERGELVAPGRGEPAREVVSCGRPRLGGGVHVVRPTDGTACAPGEVGEIWLSGPSVASAYWSDQADDARVFHAPGPGGSACLRTGDLGALVDGELYVTGRSKDLVIIRGRNHHPQDIEAASEAAHPAAQAGGAAAFGVDDGDGERLVVVQEVRRLRDEAERTGVVEAIRGAVADACDVRASDVILIRSKTLPKTSSGKVQRGATRSAYLEGRLNALHVDAPVEATRAASDVARVERCQAAPDVSPARILASVQAFLSRQGISLKALPSATLKDDLGLDSLLIFELLVQLEEEFCAPVAPDRIASLQSVGDIIATLRDDRARSDVGLRDIRDRVLERIPQLRAVVDEQVGRRLRIDGRWIADFASANYLGLDLHPEVIASVGPAIERWGVHPSWTRIVASPEIYTRLERRIAEFIGAPDVLVFPTVTLLHAGVLPLLAGPDGILFVDEEAHNSIHEAARLATTRGTALEVLPHGDVGAFEAALERHADRKRKVLAIDGVYSMSSDYAPLPRYAELAKRHGAQVYVDDAHGIGVVGEGPTPENPYGRRGNGIVRYFGLGYDDDHIVYVGGMSKAFSSLAAFVTCADEAAKRHLCGASTMVFSGPCPTASLASAIAAIDVCDSSDGEKRRADLLHLTRLLVEGARALGFEVDNNGYFPLVGVVVGDVFAVIRACDRLWEHGILITPALFPAVAMDRGLVRFTLTAANTTDQVDAALRALAAVRDESSGAHTEGAR